MTTTRSAQTLTLARKSGQEVARLPPLFLRVRSSNGDESRFRLGLIPAVVGAAPECSVALSDVGVSRQHCQLSLTEEGVILKDLGSKNGTFIGTVRVREAVLPLGAVARAGGAELALVEEGSPEAVPLFDGPAFGEALGASVPMRALFAYLQRAAATDETVVLLGDSGTGKELLARAIHEASPRREGPFVVFDSGAVPPTLIEAELFGYAKGAFTGAVSARPGLFEQAHGGTLFVDEIGELPLELQPKLLRALEAHQVRRLGSSEWLPAQARLVAATHRNLKERVRSGDFREDLYYRLAVVEARVPPLRERKEDIPLLVERFLSLLRPPKTLADLPSHAFELLQSHDWPGNVRELRNTVSRLALFPDLGGKAIQAASPRESDDSALLRLSLREAREQAVEDVERRYLLLQLKAHRGNVSAAAKAMSVSRQFVHRLMTRYDVRGADAK